MNLAWYIEPGSIANVVLIKCRECHKIDGIKNKGVPGLNYIEIESIGWVDKGGWLCPSCKFN